MLLLIDSRDKTITTDSNSNFTINLNNQINNITSIKLKKTMMNHIIHNISSEYENNEFTFTELGDDITFLISNGYYTPSQLCTHITTGMNAETLNGYIYSCTYNAIQSTFTITCTDNFNLPVSTLGTYMGFSTAQVMSNSYTSNNSNINDPLYCYLNVSFFPQTGVSSSNNYYNFIISNNSEESEYNGLVDQCFTFTQPFNIKTFTVTLKNRNNTLVELNGTNYAFVLELNTLN